MDGSETSTENEHLSVQLNDIPLFHDIDSKAKIPLLGENLTLQHIDAALIY